MKGRTILLLSNNCSAALENLLAFFLKAAGNKSEAKSNPAVYPVYNPRAYTFSGQKEMADKIRAALKWLE